MMSGNGKDYVYDITEIKKVSDFHPRGVIDQSDTSFATSISPNTENATTKSAGDFRKSLDVDSEGRELSEGQQEYFKDSKIQKRIEDGIDWTETDK